MDYEIEMYYKPFFGKREFCWTTQVKGAVRVPGIGERIEVLTPPSEDRNWAGRVFDVRTKEVMQKNNSDEQPRRSEISVLADIIPSR